MDGTWTEAPMASARKTIPGSERSAPLSAQVGAPDPQAPVEASVYLKRAPALARVTRAALRERREAGMRAAFDRLAAFAEDHGLRVLERHAGRGFLKLAGPVEAVEAAFGTRLQLFQGAAGAFRARSGALSAPAEVADLVEAVLGLDQRPVATPKSVRLRHAAADAGHLPDAVTRLYGFPAGDGRGETLALIELGGGVSPADTEAAFKAMGLPTPPVASVLVSGGTDAPGKDPDADGEVALDVQVAGAGAPGAALAVYFAPNTDQGFVDAVSQAAHDEARRPSVMSISWGGPESGWTAQAVAAMSSAFQDAADLGVSVFAASGDGLAVDGLKDGRAHVDFPASSPLVVGCGGTRLASSTTAAGETVWNSEGGGTGGGISDLFAPPDYQARVRLPASVNPGGRIGRGVPDVAADADPQTGYRVVVDGRAEVIGGTSAAAPLWAGLFALVNAAAGEPVGRPHAALYAAASAFNDVRHGDNRSGGIGYAAAAGWDACTGLGSPKGAAVAALFTAAKPKT